MIEQSPTIAHARAMAQFSPLANDIYRKLDLTEQVFEAIIEDRIIHGIMLDIHTHWPLATPTLRYSADINIALTAIACSAIMPEKSREILVKNINASSSNANVVAIALPYLLENIYPHLIITEAMLKMRDL